METKTNRPARRWKHVGPLNAKNPSVGYEGYPYAWHTGLPMPPKPKKLPPKGKKWVWRRIIGPGNTWTWVARRPKPRATGWDPTSKQILAPLKTGLTYLMRYKGRKNGMVCEKCIRGILKPPEQRCPEYTEEVGRTCPILKRFADEYSEYLWAKPHIKVTASHIDVGRLVQLASHMEYARWCVEEAGEVKQIMCEDGGLDYGPTESMKYWGALGKTFDNAVKQIGLHPKDVISLTESVQKGDSRTRRAQMLAAKIIQELPPAQGAEEKGQDA